MAALIIRAGSLPLEEFWRIATEPRALASYRLTFGASLLAACVNAVFGFIIAWTLVRYRLPGPPARRRHHRSAVRFAHGRVGHRARYGVRADGLAR